MRTTLIPLTPPLRIIKARHPFPISFPDSLLGSSSNFRPELTDDAAALVHLLDECQSPRSLPSLRDLHSRLLDRSLASHPSVQIKLMRAYAACGDPARARRVFDGASAKTTIFFNVMIRSYVTHGLHREALLLFSQMARLYRVKADHYTFPCALKACSDSENLQGGLQIHGAVAKLGLDANLFVGNTLISLYSKCGCSDDAFRLFGEMSHRDVVSWNAMIAGYAQNGQFERAIEACKEMVAVGRPKPDAGTMASILPAMLNTERTNVVFVRKMFDEMPRKGLVSWNAMIAIYANNSMAAEAMNLFLLMEKEGVEPDAVTFASVLPSCGETSALAVGVRIHEFIKRKRMCPNLVLENALMDMYANCGCLKTSREVFDGMKGRDVVSWTSIIAAYGIHGNGREAISLFEQMQESGLKPDHIAFVSVLAACSHAGLLDEGRYYFKCMTDQYQMVPRIEHFACMVDLLGRAGCIEEAYDFIRQMSIEPNERVWGALLGACRVHSNMSIGLVAADNLLRLVPDQAGYYVLLSNIYARAGKWEDVMSVRSIMVSKGIKKIPGCSNVELRDRVHTFHVGDRSHPQSKDIYAKLDVLMGRMKELGYVAETEAALHDVEEEDKEGHLSMHSEKLAIAFALINTGPEIPIRITMNLRMCGDCHHAARFISSITGREIILRDTNRFHHFENGICSCSDYW
ncbi:putative pentatricopeptide repeat-containing protein At3g49142 [Phoenix dactylifera]|uniref:Pentatricopeptide repeat-containing protein At3g49142 n=1 Tax=Phoenix dactylifera TaxID=42345 RepID=A0A8B7CIW2_PHODC|nr:putative pentatricopeptide repeat-containing protein At3g49142 [Phoenix dactylifera]